MKRLLVLIMTVTSFQLMAKADQFGAGVGVGSVTILSGEYILSDKKSFDGGLAFNLGNSRKLYFHGSMLFHFPNSLKLTGQVFSWYYGLGARFISFDKDKEDDEYRIGPRASVGLDYVFSSVPIKLFSEAAFTMNLLPSTNADVDVIIGARYYF